MTLEKTRLRLGIVPLADCAPIVVAKERGFFAEQGLDVDISREPSWANIRDKVAVGALDGAQMLATMPLSMTLGLAGIREPVVAGMALNLGGNTITLATALCRRIESLGSLKAAVAAGGEPMTFAMVYPFSTHHYELRLWLAAQGIDPDRDVRLVVVPPPQMVAHLSAGNIQGFCVGEPWGSLAASLGLGEVVATSDDIFAGRIEKVFGVARAWADAHPATHQAVLRALIAAAGWCDDNPAEVAEILAQPGYVNVPLEIVRSGLGLTVFHRHAANFPWRSHAEWFLGQMRLWGHVGGVDARRLAEETFRPDLYRLAALELGLPVPLVDHKTEGDHAGPWQLAKATAPIAMGPDRMIGGTRFDPFAPQADSPALVQETLP
ncbi:MAG: CmpA/NrtA family ABC transporter substrate-binding protein [Solirubrobacterales bacterium]